MQWLQSYTNASEVVRWLETKYAGVPNTLYNLKDIHMFLMLCHRLNAPAVLTSCWIKNSKIKSIVHLLQTVFGFLADDRVHSDVCGSKLYYSQQELHLIHCTYSQQELYLIHRTYSQQELYLIYVFMRFACIYVFCLYLCALLVFMCFACTYVLCLYLCVLFVFMCFVFMCFVCIYWFCLYLCDLFVFMCFVCICVFCLYLTTNTSLYLKATESFFLKKDCLLSGTNCITIQKKIIRQRTLTYLFIYLFAIILLPSVPKLLPYVCFTFVRRISGYRKHI
jgi:hypothetical protein